MKKLLRFILPIIVVGFLSYNSVYIKKLSDVKKEPKKVLMPQYLSKYCGKRKCH
jgi:hypothetical protein